MTLLPLDPIKVEVQVLGSEVGYLVSGGVATVMSAAFPDERLGGRIATIIQSLSRERAPRVLPF